MARLLALHAYLHADSAAEQAAPARPDVKPLAQVCLPFACSTLLSLPRVAGLAGACMLV